MNYRTSDASFLPLIVFLCATSGGLLLGGCAPGDSDTSSRIEQLRKEIEATLSETKKSLKSLGPERERLQQSASEEVEKLFTFEYHVAEIPYSADKEIVGEELEKLGSDRWDCFHVEARKEVMRFYCKRRPKSYLRYVPKLL